MIRDGELSVILHTQTTDDERRFGMTNDGAVLLAIGIATAAMLWTALFVAYRHDRADASDVASASVLLVIPPLLSYYLLMDLTRGRLSLARQVACVCGLALLWLAIQRGLIYPAFGFSPALGESVANLILLPVFGVASWLAVRGFRYRQRLARALDLQHRTELQLLDAQLAPHTLFNMLNTVYAVLLSDRERAVPLFLSMSEALRHVVDRMRKRWVPLHDELDFIEHYATLERARDAGRVNIAVDARGDLEIPVPPMLLATLFENAVKHGRFADGTMDIQVSVEADETRIRLEVRNRFPHPTPVPLTTGMGVGQANVRDRLRLIYPGRSTFAIDATDGLYRAVIVIAP